MSQTRILVADDSATIQKVFELAFENEDIEVLLASDGQEALEMTLRASPSLVIADVNMPGLDGFELCQALKNDEKSASIPVYLMSSALDDFDELRSEEVGAAGRFEKPFRSEDMVSKVRAAISEIQSETPAAQNDETGDVMEEVIEDISVGESEAVEAEEDTFDDIDISLDSLLDSVERKIDLPEEEDSVIVVEDDDLSVDEETDDGAEPVVIEEEDLGEPEIMELESSSLVSSDDVDDETDEDGLEVEIISGQADDEAVIEEIVGDEMEPDMAVSAVLEEEIIEDPPLDPAFMDEELDQDNVETEINIDALEENGISEEGRMMLKAIDEELEVDQTETEKELRAAGRIKDEPAPAQSGVNKDMIMEMARNAFEEFSKSGGFHTLINEAIERFVREMLTKEEFEEAVSKGIINAISEMKPQILDDFRAIAQEMTLNVAEDLVKKTIDQIKVEQ